MSYKADVHTHGDLPGVYSGNGMRFATAEEAEVYVRELASRWLVVESWQIRTSEEPVNYHIVDGKAVFLKEVPSA